MPRVLAIAMTVVVSCNPSTGAGDVLAASVADHVDGDTISVLIDGRRERVRLIGIDTPERGMPGYADAAAFTERAAPVGGSIFLELDVEERDRYGRLLAYVWLDDPSTGVDAEQAMLNAHLLASGHAVLLTIPPNVEHVGLFSRLARAARQVPVVR